MSAKATSQGAQPPLLSHGNYNVWHAPVQAKLERGAIWCYVTGKMRIKQHPGDIPIIPSDANASECLALKREHQEEVCAHKDSLLQDDKAKGIIKDYLEPSQYTFIDGKKISKEIWDALKAHYEVTATGMVAFWIKYGMLQKRYVEGENMLDHVDFFMKENRKLGTNSFDNNFLAQLILMSLPRDGTWETIVVILISTQTLISTLTTKDVIAHLTAEWHG
jgi:hypothetical protein